MSKRAASWGFISLIIFSVNGARAEPATLDAQQISVDDESGIVSATGNVEAQAGSRLLKAQALTYDRIKEQLTIPGALTLIDGANETITAKSGLIDNALEKGRFDGLRLTTTDSGRLRAEKAERLGSLLDLEDAIYTSCPECDNPDDAPLWQIRAANITYDRVAQNVVYAHPRLEVYGLPVFYLPYMAHAGPEIDKRSGFLTPGFASSSDFGTAIDIPYFFNLAPNYDVTLTPRLSEKQEPFLTAAWRHLTANGSYRLTGYLHRPKDELTGDTQNEVRAGLMGDGNFNLGDWRLTFNLQETSDDLFFRRYKITNSSRLTSNLAASRNFGRHYIRLEGFRFRETLNQETAATVGDILPALTHQYGFAQPVLGGNLRVTNSLTHKIRALDIDETRVSSVLDWSWRHTTQGGFVLSADNRLTLDAYDFAVEAGDPLAADSDQIDDVLSANSAAFTLSYPLQRMGTNDRQTLTPKLQLVLADAADDYGIVPHIGATTRNLTRSQLFQPLTPKDEASRVNLGIDHTLQFKSRLSTRFFIGQSYNLSDKSFTPQSGFGDDGSAILTEAALYAGPLSLSQQARFSDDGEYLLRSDSTMALAYSSFNIGLDHSYYEAGQTTSNADTPLEEATARLGWQMTRKWRLDADLRENLESKERVRANAAFTYEDECTLVSITLGRDYSRVVGSIEPDTSINLSFTLKTIAN